MSRVYNKMRINVNEQITDIVTAKQNDANSRFLDVYLYDAGKPIDLTGNEVHIYMRKPDKTEIFNNGEITDATAGRCQFELTSQALAAYGVLFAEISIWKDNVEILTTQTFHIFIAESIRDDDSIESSNEYGALVVLFQNLYQSLDLMKDMLDNFGTPGAIAEEYNVATFWGISEAILDALKKSGTDAIMERLGESIDTLDSGTVFGAINGVKNNVAEIDNAVSGLNSAIVNNGINALKIKTISMFEKTYDVQSNQNASVNLINYTGKGFIGFWMIRISSPNNGYLRITVDGTTLATLNGRKTLGGTADSFGFIPIFFTRSISVYFYNPTTPQSQGAQAIVNGFVHKFE